MELDGRRLLVTNPDGLLWPDDGISKGDLIEYYLAIAEHVMPFFTNRPISLLRCSDGVLGDCVYQKTAPVGLPTWVATRRIRTEPVAPIHGFDQVLAAAETITRMARQREPSLFTLDMRRARRRGKILIDVHRNHRGATLVSPYAVREYPGAPVSTPLEWHELERGIYPDDFRLANTRERLARIGDPLARFTATRQTLAPILESGRARRARPMA